MDLQRIDEGRTAEVFLWDKGRILKLYRDGFPREWADWEAQMTRAIHEAGVPAPRIFEVRDVDGRRGVVMEQISGRSMSADLRTNWLNVIGHARWLAELHVQMHRRPVTELPKQHDSLKQRIQEAPVSAEIRDEALRRLERLPEGTAVCHGDFHPGHVVLTARGPRILDWLTATCGNPLGDVARTSLILRLSEPDPEARGVRIQRLARDIFHSMYLNRYLQLRPVSRAAIDAWLLPVAIARTLEDVDHERLSLPRLIESLATHAEPD